MTHAHRDALTKKGGGGERVKGREPQIASSHARAAALCHDSVTRPACIQSFSAKGLVRTNERINEVLPIIGR